MMHSSGTTEGLRGLIDSSLVKSIMLIMEHRALFGSSVLPLAINIMTTFIHNEPTSLHVIQEAKLPEVFYSAIESGLEPIMEVIQSVPNAMGALCLNQAGANQLLDRPQVLERFFGIFTTNKHVKLLQDKDNAVMVGNAIDELVRHHPALCDRVFAAIAQVLENIETSGRHLEENSTSSHLYRLVTKPENQSAGEKIKESNQDVTWDSNVDRTPMEVEMEGNELAAEARKVENPVTASLDVFSRVSGFELSSIYLELIINPVPRRALPACSALQGFRREGQWPRAPVKNPGAPLSAFRLRIVCGF
jgi:E3 ubiquitin-protein ligase HUWE1